MVELIVKGYNYKELDGNARENANYEIECFVDEVYSYNRNLYRQEELLQCEKEEKELCNAYSRVSMQIKECLSNLTPTTIGSSVVHKLCELVAEKEKLVGEMTKVSEKLNDIKALKRDYSLSTRYSFEYVAYAFCDENEIYFTVEGYPLFNGNHNTEIKLEEI